ncbi:hypothetical protein N9Q04_01195, partial [Burkholderiales bacterium]|nr:hypothetical protein [Burkholderiales bacterium]
LRLKKLGISTYSLGNMPPLVQHADLITHMAQFMTKRRCKVNAFPYLRGQEADARIGLVRYSADGILKYP